MQIKKVINIQIPIKTDDYLENFIFKNINYGRKVWNDFVEEAKKFEGDDCMYDEFIAWKFKTKYFNNEDNNNIYNEFCVGISEMISTNVMTALRCIRKENYNITHSKTRINEKLHKLNFHKFDKYYGSFKVGNKPIITKSKNKNISSRIDIVDPYTLTFRVRGGSSSKYPKEQLTIHLKESLFKYKCDNDDYLSFIREYKVKGENIVECWFTRKDIKETSFIHKLGKFYIQLSIKVTYFINDKDIKSRQPKAGIDTGIHNPAVLYDGDKCYRISMPEYMVQKLHYLERRARRLQKIMRMKRTINEQRKKRGELESIYTKNYEKVKYKFRKVWNKIVNIKRNWRFNMCKFIVTRFQKICVDRFTQPANQNIKPNSLKRKFNFINRFHCMYSFNDILEHMANKYGCEYISSPEDTTRTCSICGHINPHLPLSQRYLVCEECCTSIDRDENATQNCYMSI